MTRTNRLLGTVAVAFLLGWTGYCSSSMSTFAGVSSWGDLHRIFSPSVPAEAGLNQDHGGRSIVMPEGDFSSRAATTNIVKAGEVTDRQLHRLALAPDPTNERSQPEDIPARRGTEGLTPLARPSSFSDVPTVVPGVQVVLTRYLSFQIPSGRKVYARMFVFESNMKRVVFDRLDPEVVDRRRALPQRLSAMAQEIEVPNPATFTADFDIPDHFVSTVGNGIYEVNLGALTCMVRTVASAQ